MMNELITDAGGEARICFLEFFTPAHLSLFFHFLVFQGSG